MQRSHLTDAVELRNIVFDVLLSLICCLEICLFCCNLSMRVLLVNNEKQDLCHLSCSTSFIGTLLMRSIVSLLSRSHNLSLFWEAHFNAFKPCTPAFINLSLFSSWQIKQFRKSMGWWIRFRLQTASMVRLMLSWMNACFHNLICFFDCFFLTLDPWQIIMRLNWSGDTPLVSIHWKKNQTLKLRCLSGILIFIKFFLLLRV